MPVATKQRRPKQFKLVKSTPAQIAKRNRDFERMTPQQKRVAVAKDAIAMLKVRKIVASRGSYFLVPNDSVFYEASAAAGPQVQLCDVISGIPSCNVCAIGAVFVSAVSRFDRRVSGGGGYLQVGSDSMKEYLSQMGIFYEPQLSLMEYAFEGWTDGETEESVVAGKMYPKSIKPRERLIEILKNVIKNSGTFVVA